MVLSGEFIVRLGGGRLRQQRGFIREIVSFRPLPRAADTGRTEDGVLLCPPEEQRVGVTVPDPSTDAPGRGPMKRFLSVLLWSVLAAAFIGPGTVTTAASAGASHRYQLLWALAFSTLACLVLQEAAARLTAVSGLTLGEALRQRFGGGAGAVVPLVVGAVVFGCAAYEAGNILGAVAGVSLILGGPAWAWALCFGLGAGVLLWLGSPRGVALTLSAFVALMGATFLVTAVLLGPSPGELVRGTLTPSTPAGSGLLILGLVGTTVVPYNLFLGSGLARGEARGQELSVMRFGLAVAVLLGGGISMGVLVVGGAVDGEFSYPAVAAVLSGRLGGWAAAFFGLGLSAAGLSSAITAPLAAALAARGLSRDPAGEGAWGNRSWPWRAVWGGVLTTGIAFGVADVPPIPAILLAQAANGVLLPLVAIFLLLAVNDRRLLGEGGRNGPLANAIAVPVVFVTLVLGLAGVVRAGARVLDRPVPGEGTLLVLALVLALILAVPVGRMLLSGRRQDPQ